MIGFRLIPVLLVLSLGLTSCWFGKKKAAPRVFIPPPVRRTPSPLPPQPEISEGPGIEAKVTFEPPVGYPGTIPVVPPPPAPAKRPVVVAPKAPAVTPQPEPTPAPRLGQIFTADQLRDYNRNLDDSLDRVKRALAAIERKNLNAEQAETANRIRTFQKQAEQAREQDLVTAVNLARRADLLAQDLLQRLP
jgi:hypothetical protein